MEQLKNHKLNYILLKNKNIYLKTFDYKNIDKEYINWFSGKNLDLKFSRHFKKKYNRLILIKNLRNFLNSDNLFIGIFNKFDEKLVGTITIYINMKRKQGNLGIFIGNKKYNSKGYALESCFIIINYLMRKKILKSLVAGTSLNNVKMINLMKRLNMKRTYSKNSKYVNYILRSYL